MKKLLGDVLPGEVFEVSGAKELGCGSLCLKLHEQKIINLDTMRAWKFMDQKIGVTVIGKFSELFSFDHHAAAEAKIKR